MTQEIDTPASSVICRKFMYMRCLQRTFNEPAGLLEASGVPLLRRKFLLKRWRDDRTLYLAENCRDYDYLQDIEMESLLWAVDEIKQNAARYA
jgi:hypothetical protein